MSVFGVSLAPIRIPGIPAALSSWLILYSLHNYILVRRWFLEIVQKMVVAENVPAEGANEVADGACCFIRVWWVAVHLELTDDRIKEEKKDGKIQRRTATSPKVVMA